MLDKNDYSALYVKIGLIEGPVSGMLSMKTIYPESDTQVDTNWPAT